MLKFGRTPEQVAIPACVPAHRIPPVCSHALKRSNMLNACSSHSGLGCRRVLGGRGTKTCLPGGFLGQPASLPACVCAGGGGWVWGVGGDRGGGGGCVVVCLAPCPGCAFVPACVL